MLLNRETVCQAVGGRVCPSVNAIMGLEVSEKRTSYFFSKEGRNTDLSGAPKDKFLPKEAGARLGWGDDRVNSDIINTMMKLLPDDVLHLLVYRHRYATKSSVIDFVRFRHPQYVHTKPNLSPPTTTISQLLTK